VALSVPSARRTTWPGAAAFTGHNMQFPLPGKTDYVKLHRQIYYKLGPAAADLFALMATELKAAHEETELWQGRAEKLRKTHPDFINEDKGKHQRSLRDRYSIGKNTNE